MALDSGYLPYKGNPPFNTINLWVEGMPYVTF